MAEDPAVSSDLSGIPIEYLIGGPVQAAARAEMFSAKATSDFINAVGFNPPVLDQEGKVVTPASVRNVNFEFVRPIQDSKTGEVLSETVSVQLPLLAMVSIPNFLIQMMDVTFDIEITQALPATTETPSETKLPNLGPEMQLLGKVTTPADHIRSTDYASRYHVELHAADSGPSEALSRVIDMMAHAVAPSQIRRSQVGDQQGTPSGSNASPGEPA